MLGRVGHPLVLSTKVEPYTPSLSFRVDVPPCLLTITKTTHEWYAVGTQIRQIQISKERTSGIGRTR